MPRFTRVEGEKNLFTDEHGNFYSVLEGEMKPVDTDSDGDGSNNQINVSDIDDEFGMDFLSDKFKEGDKKVANGEISCNLDNPEDCINCGS
mgnify:CR=1 FL=1